MSWWRKAAELTVTIVLVLILAFAVLGSMLVEDHTEIEYVVIGLILLFGSFIKLGAIILLRRRDRLYAAAVQDARATVRLARPVADVVVILACFWAATVGSGFMWLGGGNTGLGWFVPLALLILLGVSSIAGTMGLLRNRAQCIVLSPSGLQSNRFGDVTIAWPDIRSAELIGIGRFGSLKVIILKLVDEAKYLPRKKKPFWARGDRLTLGTSFTIPLSLDVSSKLVLQAITARLSAFGSAANPNSAMKET